MMKLGLRARLMLAISALITAIAGFFAYYFPSKQEEAANAALETRAVAVSTILAKLVAPGGRVRRSRRAAHRAQATSRISPTCSTWRARPGRQHLLLRYRSQGVERLGGAGRPVTEQQITNRNNALHVSIPVRGKDNGLIGTVVAGFSRHSDPRHPASRACAPPLSSAPASS